MFQTLDRPSQCIIERLRLGEIETLELGAELLHVDARCDRAGLNAPARGRKLERQPVLDPRAVRRTWKQRRNRARQGFGIQTAAPSA